MQSEYIFQNRDLVHMSSKNEYVNKLVAKKSCIPPIIQ